MIATRRQFCHALIAFVTPYLGAPGFQYLQTSRIIYVANTALLAMAGI
jgi:hypothetical protein